MEVNQLKKFEFKFNCLSQSDGSCQLEHGDYKVLASVNGPIEVKQHLEKIDQATLEVIVTPVVGVTSTKQKYIENLIQNLFKEIILTKLNARTLIQINLQQLAHVEGVDGEASFINATTLALLNAGIPMDRTVVALSSAVDHDGSIIVDPSPEEIKSSKSHHTFAFSSKESEPLSIYSWGQFNLTEVDKCKKLCYSNVDKLLELIRN